MIGNDTAAYKQLTTHTKIETVKKPAQAKELVPLAVLAPNSTPQLDLTRATE